MSAIARSALLGIMLTTTLNTSGCFAIASAHYQEEEQARAEQVWFKNKNLTDTRKFLLDKLTEEPSVKAVHIDTDGLAGQLESGTNFSISFTVKGKHTGVTIRVNRGLGISSGDYVAEYNFRNFINSLAGNKTVNPLTGEPQ